MAKTLPHDSPWLLALLAALVAMGPLSVDMYLPAMPYMKTALGADVAGMHLTLSSYLVGFALFHLLCGPLADRYGRRPILFAGASLFIIACLGCSQSKTLEEMLAFRFLQGVGACVGPTLARAVTRDIFGPTRAARALSLIAMIMALAPAIAPGLGGIMLLALPWSSIFYFLAAYGAVTLLLVSRYLAESLPARQSLHPAAIARNFWELFCDPYYLLVISASGLIYAGLLAYLSSSSFVYIDMLGVPTHFFGLVFVTTVIGYILGSALSARLSSSLPSELVLCGGTTLAFFSVALMLAATYLVPASVIALVLPTMSYSIGMGLVLPHSMAIALRPFPHIAGTASAMLGFVQMALSALASAVSGYLLQDSPRPMVWTMFAICLLAMGLGLLVCRHYRRSGA